MSKGNVNRLRFEDSYLEQAESPATTTQVNALTRVKDAFYFPFGETTTIIPGSYDANVVEKASLYQQPPYEFDSVPVTSVTSDLPSLDETELLLLKNGNSNNNNNNNGNNNNNNNNGSTSTSSSSILPGLDYSSSQVTTTYPPAPIKNEMSLGRNNPDENSFEVTLDESAKLPYEPPTTTSVSLVGNLGGSGSSYSSSVKESPVTMSPVNNNQQVEVKSTKQTSKYIIYHFTLGQSELTLFLNVLVSFYR